VNVWIDAGECSSMRVRVGENGEVHVSVMMLTLCVVQCGENGVHFGGVYCVNLVECCEL